MGWKGDGFFTTEAISLLQRRFLYYSFDFFTTEAISLLQRRLLICTIRDHEIVDFWFASGGDVFPETTFPIPGV